MPTNHEDRESFACDHCGKCFTWRENLNRHVKNHGDKVHICHVCFKAFTRSDLLKRHAALHGQEESTSINSPEPKRRKMNRADRQISTGMPVDGGSDIGSARRGGLMSPSDAVLTGQTNAPFTSQIPQNERILEAWPFDITAFDSRSDFSGSWDDHMLFDFPGLGSYDLPHRGLDEAPRETSTNLTGAESISRATSPPNEASHDDRTPFAWTPSSKQLPEPREVTFSSQDPLWQENDPTFEVNGLTYETLRSAAMTEAKFEGRCILQPLSSFPSMTVVNIFLAEFAKHFHPQAPALHLPTLDMNVLPISLLAIMISIGATYCNRRSTRRFSIVLQDWARSYLLLAVQSDSTLLRSSDTIYAAALICYAGLWNGNKRSFELAEAMRGNVIAWLRRSVIHTSDNMSAEQSVMEDTNSAWRTWVREEKQRRLQWVVFSLIDCQYASLMNIQPMMSLNEVRDWECPCDEDYWTAANPRQWKSLFGRAASPPSRALATALAPMIGSRSRMAPCTLNNWSALLVLWCLAMRVIRRVDERHLLGQLASNDLDIDRLENDSGVRTDTQSDLKEIKKWQRHYGAPIHPKGVGKPPSIFDAVAMNQIDLIRVYALVPIQDLQDILGRSQVDGIQRARSRFEEWLKVDTSSFLCATSEVIDILRPYYTTSRDAPASGSQATSFSAPHSSIVVFLAHTLLYACSTVSGLQHKTALLDHVMTTTELAITDPIYRLVDLAFGEEASKDPSGRQILRCGAEVLAKYENWACSLNLALLLHWRSRM